MKKLILAAVLGLLSGRASAHCPISYVISGPGGLLWQLSLDGDLYDGMLPGGTPSQLGSMTSWTDTRRLGPTTGVVPLALTVTDGSHYAVCPPVMLNLSGPPRCSEDYDAPGEVPHPTCIPYFTVVQTAPGVFACASTCQPGSTYPAPQSYAPPSGPPPSASGLSPSSARTATPGLALRVDGSGFTGAAVVRWNGTPLATYVVNAASVVAAVPPALLASSGGVSITVSIPGRPDSAPLAFTVAP